MANQPKTPAIEAKRPRLITSAVEGETLTLTVEGAGVIVIDAATLSPDVRAAALMHGLRQKVADAAAAPAGTPLADRFADMEGVAQSLRSGDWSQRSAGDGTAKPSGLILKAYTQWVLEQFAARGRPAPTGDTIRAKYDAMEHKAKLALRTVPEIAVIMETLRSAKSPTVSGDDLLGDFL